VIFRRRDATLFLTHTPWAFPISSEVERDGRKYQITRQVRQAPTRLLNGSQAECYEIRGVELEAPKVSIWKVLSIFWTAAFWVIFVGWYWL